MGQHKRNPTAIAAKKGEIAPKPEEISSREKDRRFMAEMTAYMILKAMTYHDKKGVWK